jgi:hypothetical protein
MDGMTFGFGNPLGRAYRFLYIGFIVAPILFGLDKFFNVMTDWTKYLAPWIPNLLHVTPQTFMYGVGIVEIAAGILVAFIPRYAAYVVAAWLLGIIVNLVTGYGYYDIALRDFGLMLGALSLAQLAQARYEAARDIERTEPEVVEYHTPVRTTTTTPTARAA